MFLIGGVTHFVNSIWFSTGADAQKVTFGMAHYIPRVDFMCNYLMGISKLFVVGNLILAKIGRFTFDSSNYPARAAYDQTTRK
jgi:hypothetical protein